MPKDSSLDQLRDSIRTIDDEILMLMQKRLELAKQVGQVKLANNIPIKNFKVEKDVIARARTRAKDLGLYESLAEDVAKLQIRYAVMTQEEDHSRSVSDDTAARRVLIVGGSGSMGIWMTRFFKSFGHKVSIYDRERSELIPEGVSFSSDLKACVADAEFILVATPISATAKLINELAQLKPKGIVIDICSLKSPILEPIAQAEKAGLRITSMHPMFGPNTELLSGQNIVFCETDDKDATEQAMSLFTDTTANLVRIPLARHDELMGYVLGMSHMLNLAFAKAIDDSRFTYKELESVASSTFRAQMNVAIPIINENQDLYFEIQSGNAHTEDLFKEMIKAFRAYLDSVSNNDRDSFKKYMSSSLDFFKK